MSRGPRANRPGSAHGVPFVGMRGSLPRAPACAGARFSGSRRRSRLLADPLRRGWRPRWRGLHSHPLLLAVCVPTGRDPRPVPSYLRSLQPRVNRQCGGGCSALHEPRNCGAASTSHGASPSNDASTATSLLQLAPSNRNVFFLNRDALTKLLLQRQGFERGMRRRGFGRAAVVRKEAFLH